MSGIELQPLSGGKNIAIPDGKTTIGRGQFLQVNDKRVSRKHAVVEVKEQKLIITPIHTNPCFYRAGGKGEKITLKKDVPKVLQNGDTFALLPDQLFYKVIAPNSEVENGDEEETDDEYEELEKTKNTCTTVNRNTPLTPQNSKKKTLLRKNSKMSCGSPKQLPKWMQGAAKRMSAIMETANQKTSPAKRTTASNVRSTPRKAVKNFKEESEDEFEEEKEQTPTKRVTKRSRRDVSDDSDADSPAKRTGQRRASLKVAKYTDDYVLSDEEIELSEPQEESEEEYSPQKEDSDEDFYVSDDISEEESPSDWEEERRSKKSTRRGSRRSRRSMGTRRSSRRAARRNRYEESDESDDFEDDFSDEEEYRPRVSKRRAQGRSSRRRQQSSEDDSEEESEVEEKPKKRAAVRKRKAPSESEEEESEEDVAPKKKQGTRKKQKTSEEETNRKSCMYGKKCYRKNPQHFKEFCHPGDESYDSDEAREEKATFDNESNSKNAENDNKGSPKKDKEIKKTENDEDSKNKNEEEPKKELREKDKKSVLHNASDDDGEPNTYDRNDSFLNDETIASKKEEESEGSDEVNESEEEDIKSLVKDARNFLRNKKLAKT